MNTKGPCTYQSAFWRQALPMLLKCRLGTVRCTSWMLLLLVPSTVVPKKRTISIHDSGGRARSACHAHPGRVGGGPQERLPLLSICSSASLPLSSCMSKKIIVTLLLSKPTFHCFATLRIWLSALVTAPSHSSNRS